MNDLLNNMIKGLAFHYMHMRTVEEAISQGKEGGISAKLLESLPGMMFEITCAAAAVYSGGRTFNEMVDEVLKRARASGSVDGFKKKDAIAFIKFTLDFFKELSEEFSDDSPLPPMNEPWYKYKK